MLFLRIVCIPNCLICGISLRVGKSPIPTSTYTYIILTLFPALQQLQENQTPLLLPGMEQVWDSYCSGAGFNVLFIWKHPIQKWQTCHKLEHWYKLHSKQRLWQSCDNLCLCTWLSHVVKFLQDPPCWKPYSHKTIEQDVCSPLSRPWIGKYMPYSPSVATALLLVL